jgi:hypothetical protein
MDFSIKHYSKQAAAEKDNEFSDEDDAFKRFDKIINEYANLNTKLNN